MNTIPPVSTILPEGFSNHVKVGISEQMKLYGAKRIEERVKLPTPMFKVTLTSKGVSVTTKGVGLDKIFKQAIDRFIDENKRAKVLEVIIKFRWKGCEHWRAVPCEFGNALNIIDSKPRLHYSCNCGCEHS